MARTHRHTFEAKTKMYHKQGLDVKGRYPKRRNLGHGRHIIGCTCELCKYGLHNSAFSEAQVRRLIRGDRRKVRVALREGREVHNDRIPYGYTD